MRGKSRGPKAESIRKAWGNFRNLGFHVGVFRPWAALCPASKFAGSAQEPTGHIQSRSLAVTGESSLNSLYIYTLCVIKPLAVYVLSPFMSLKESPSGL